VIHKYLGKQFLLFIRYYPRYSYSQDASDNTGRKQTQTTSIRLPSYKQVRGKDEPNIVLCGDRTRHYNTEPRLWRHIQCIKTTLTTQTQRHASNLSINLEKPMPKSKAVKT